MRDLVGTLKGAWSTLEKNLIDRPWETVREGVQVKLFPQDGESLCKMAQSAGRVDRERALRRKKLRRNLTGHAAAEVVSVSTFLLLPDANKS